MSCTVPFAFACIQRSHPSFQKKMPVVIIISSGIKYYKNFKYAKKTAPTVA